MHIPTADTDTLELLPFREALEKSGQRGDYDAARWLYVPDFLYRVPIHSRHARGGKPLICIGVNPSTAAPDALDPTLQSVQRIALSNGYDSFIMFNVYAQRATRPNDMDAALNEHLHAENMAAFRYVLEASLPPPSGGMGNLGQHHRNAPVSPALRFGHDRRRRGAWRGVVHGGQALRKGPSPSSALSAARYAARPI